MVRHFLLALACWQVGQSGGGSIVQAWRPFGRTLLGSIPSSSSSSQELPELAGVIFRTLRTM